MTRQEQLNEAWCKYRGKFSTEIMHALAFAMRWCDAHPAWISVEDELPKETNMYIVVHHNVVCTMSWYANLEEWAEIYVDENECVQSRQMYGITHWMPLPQPPKKGGEHTKEEIKGNQGKISPNQQQIIGTEEHIKIALDVMEKGGEQ